MWFCIKNWEKKIEIKIKKILTGARTFKNLHALRVTLKLLLSLCYFHKAGPMRAPWIWFHREVVNMPLFSTSLLFWHAQLRRSSSKVSARGCGQCRSAFTHTQTYASPVSAHNMGGCYCQCPLAEPGLKHTVGAELDSMRKVKLWG